MTSLFGGLIVFAIFAAPPIVDPHYDIDGFCPMALDSIQQIERVSPVWQSNSLVRQDLEKALRSWKEFADYYRCAGSAEAGKREGE